MRGQQKQAAASIGRVALELGEVWKSYGSRTVLAGVTLAVERGERLAVVGPSGSGKSTLLRVLAGLERADRGAAAGTGPPRTVLVPQRPHLFTWLTVAENVRVGGGFRTHRGRFEESAVEELLSVFGLSELSDLRPDQLSGGQAQRVAVARALAVRPEVLLLDEPFSALDPATRAGLRVWLRDTARQRGLTLVVVTHDVDEALYLADTVLLLDNAGSIARSWRVAEQDHAFGEHPLRTELLGGYDLAVVTR